MPITQATISSAVGLALTVLAASRGTAQQVPAPTVLAVTGATLIDGTGAPPREGVTVLVSGGRIIAVGPGRSVVLPSHVTRIDGRGRFLIPGLWDMHVHMASRPLVANAGPAPDLSIGAGFFFPYLLVHGVTGVRDMSGELGTLVQWRREVQAGRRPGPRLVVTGRKLRENGPVVTGAPILVRTGADVRRSVELLKAGGADFVKLEALPDSLYPVLMDAARAEGLPVVGHVPPNLGAGRAGALGFRSLEHLMDVLTSVSRDSAALRRAQIQGPGWWDRLRLRLGLVDEGELQRRAMIHTLATQDDGAAAALWRQLISSGTWMVPTLVANRDVRVMRPDTGLAASTPALLPAVFRLGQPAWWSRDSALARQTILREVALVGQMQRAGVRLLAGTDMPGAMRLPGESLIEELELFVSAGLTAAEALRSATLGPAEFLGAVDSMGTIQPGKVADLVLLEANPLQRIGDLRKVVGVMTAGRYWSRRQLDSMVTQADSLRRVWDSAP
ncbi:MAG: amidohydrolase family protein [Gemmatimonadales bacterium]